MFIVFHSFINLFISSNYPYVFLSTLELFFDFAGTRKKKNSDQQVFPDIKVLLRENQLLKEKLAQVEFKKKEVSFVICLE